MSEKVHLPAANPCGSCPYRRDVPGGIWSAEEYAKLPQYDRPTGEQPPNMFLCHQNTGALCAGWVGVHDMGESLGIRLGLSFGIIAVEDLDAIDNYSTTTPLFASGAEAGAHGLKGIRKPSVKAKKTILKLAKKRLTKAEKALRTGVRD